MNRNIRGLVASLSVAGLIACGSADSSSPTDTGDPPPGSSSFSLDLGSSTFLRSFGETREVAFDSQGNMVAVGWTGQSRPQFPPEKTTTFGPLGMGDLFVVKLSADASELLWAVILGGSGKDRGYGVDLDASDNVYVAGQSSVEGADDFPTTPGAFDRTNNGGSAQCFGPHGCDLDAYVLKLSPDGKSLLYSTLLGSSDDDGARGGVAVDDEGAAYVAGFTGAGDFLDGDGGTHPATMNTHSGGRTDGFVTKVSPDGSSIVYSRFVGAPNPGENGDVVVGVAVDGAGEAHVNAIVRGSGAITTSDAFQPGYGGGVADGYYARFSADGSEVRYGTYLGGSGAEFAEHRIVVDASGNVHVSGRSDSPDFPIISAGRTGPGGGLDAYLVKFAPDGQPIFSAVIGGAGEDGGFGPAVDEEGRVFMAGPTHSEDFPVTETAFQSNHGGGDRDVFLAVYDSSGDLIYSTFFGGNQEDRARFVALTSAGEPVLTGGSSSSDFPLTEGAFDSSFNGEWDGMVSRFTVSGGE